MTTSNIRSWQPQQDASHSVKLSKLRVDLLLPLLAHSCTHRAAKEGETHQNPAVPHSKFPKGRPFCLQPASGSLLSCNALLANQNNIFVHRCVHAIHWWHTIMHAEKVLFKVAHLRTCLILFSKYPLISNLTVN